MLNLDKWTVLFQIINFLILTGALYFLLFKPVMRGMREQAEKKKNAEQELEENRSEIGRARSELAARLASTEDEAKRLITNAQEEAEALRQSLLEAAEQEAERLLAEAHSDAERIQEQLVADFQDDLLDTITAVSRQVIGRITPQASHDTMVQQLSDRIWEMGRSEMQRVDEFRRALGTRVPTAFVTSARPINTEQQALLIRTFAALADRQVNIDVKVNTELSAGLRVRLGDLIIDNSVAGQLEELRDGVAETLNKQLRRGADSE
jgi:F-type H+-transporting ATPase subunit b